MPTIDAQALQAYATAIFEATGAPTADAETVADHLVQANLKGHDSHGVIRIAQYITSVESGAIKPGVSTKIERETPSTAVVNGNLNYGQVVGHDTMAAAIEKARGEGVGVAVGYRMSHAGRIGTYGEQAAAAGMVSILAAGIPGSQASVVAPFGGAAGRLTTNPIVIACPTENPEAPFVLDMATSMAAEGKLRVARNKGAQVPEGWIIDAEGKPTTDPWDFYGGDPPGSRPRGAILPVGGSQGHKGYGLAMAVELLAGALCPVGATQAAEVSIEDGGGGNNLFALAIDPERLAGHDAFTGAMGRLIDYVKQPPYAEGFDEILTAGDYEQRNAAKRLADGIELDDETWRQINEAAAAVNVAAYDGPLR